MLVKIAPSLLALIEGKGYSFEHAVEALQKGILETQSADYYHIDVMDGKFVKQVTDFRDPKLCEEVYSMTGIPLDVHLMVADPYNYIDKFAEYSEIITFHSESTNSPKKIISFIQSYGKKAGIALNPHTPIEDIYDVLDDVDMVLLMSVIPGECGQKYHEHVTGKIRALTKEIMRRKLNTMIQVDGGIKLENAHLPISAGADVPGGLTLVSGSGIYGAQKNATIIEMKKVYQ